MTGVTIAFDAQRALDTLLVMQERLDNPHDMLAKMGEELLDIHEKRFDEQRSPDGVPWAPLQPWYQATKTQNADKILTLRGHLRGGLRWQIRANTLLFGTNRIDGAIHHFGGIIRPVHAAALNVHGRLVKQVKIPARPWLGISVNEGKQLTEIARGHLTGKPH